MKSVMKPRDYFVMVALALVPGCAPAKQTAAVPPVVANPARGATPTARGTIALAKLQTADGGFSGATANHVGITGLAGLALLSCGDVAPSTIAPHIQKAAEFILQSQDALGYFNHEGDSGGMYGHAFAALFLTQLYATTSDAALKTRLADSINKAIHLIEVSQNPQGGWRYTPKPADADVSVTAAELKALTAAKEVGFTVPEKTMARAISYLKSAQQPNGGFSYTLESGSTGWPRSAAATAALLYAGAHLDIDKALAYLQQPNQPHTNRFNFFYGNYYLAQALSLNPDKTKSAVSLRAALLAKQDPGTFLWNGEAGEAYATAMALIVLYMPDSHLPAFKPPASQPAPAP